MTREFEGYPLYIVTKTSSIAILSSSSCMMQMKNVIFTWLEFQAFNMWQPIKVSISLTIPQICSNNIPSVIPQVGSGEGGMYVDLAQPFVGREVSNRPSAQKKCFWSAHTFLNETHFLLCVLFHLQACGKLYSFQAKWEFNPLERMLIIWLK